MAFQVTISTAWVSIFEVISYGRQHDDIGFFEEKELAPLEGKNNRSVGLLANLHSVTTKVCQSYSKSNKHTREPALTNK